MGMSMFNNGGMMGQGGGMFNNNVGMGQVNQQAGMMNNLQAQQQYLAQLSMQNPIMHSNLQHLAGVAAQQNPLGIKTPYALVYFPIENEKEKAAKNKPAKANNENEEETADNKKSNKNPPRFRDAFSIINKSPFGSNPLASLEEKVDLYSMSHAPPVRTNYATSVNLPFNTYKRPNDMSLLNSRCNFKNNYGDHRARSDTTSNFGADGAITEPELRRGSDKDPGEKRVPASLQTSPPLYLNKPIGKRIAIRLLDGSLVMKTFPEDTMVAGILRSIFENELGGINGYPIENFCLLLRKKKLNLFSVVNDLSLRPDDILQLEHVPEGKQTSNSITNSPIEVADLTAHQDTSEKSYDLKPVPAPIEMVPILERSGYQTIPTYNKICRMTEEELSNVKEFTVLNKHGSVRFQGSVDLRYLNIGKIVDISHRSVDIYPEDSGIVKPSPGKGLNQPTYIEFFNFGLAQMRGDDDTELLPLELQTKIANWVKKIDAKLVTIDPLKDSVKIFVEKHK